MNILTVKAKGKANGWLFLNERLVEVNTWRSFNEVLESLMCTFASCGIDAEEYDYVEVDCDEGELANYMQHVEDTEQLTMVLEMLLREKQAVVVYRKQKELE